MKPISRPHPLPGPKCTLRSLENPSLNGILLGLEIRDNELHVLPDYFPCCSGIGEKLDPNHQAVIRCDLKARYRATRDLLVQYYRTWDGHLKDAPHRIPADKSAVLLQQIGKTLRGDGPQATVIQGIGGQPGTLWPMALAATWRFGLATHVVNFLRSPQHDLLPRPAYDHKGPLLIFVEQITQLWKPENAMHLEAVISFAYKSNSLLWLEFLNTAANGEEDSVVSAKLAFQQRVKNLKSKSPLSYLEASCITELKSMTRLPRQIPTLKDVIL